MCYTRKLKMDFFVKKLHELREANFYNTFMSNFSFGGLKVTSKKQAMNLKIENNPILIDKRNAFASYNFTVTILADEYYDSAKLKLIDEFLASNGIRKYIMLCAINCRISKEAIKANQKQGVIDFYMSNRSDYEKYIEPLSPIITVGPALYSHLREDDIYPSHVQQVVFGKSSFWFSFDRTSKGNYIYPIESFTDLFTNPKPGNQTIFMNKPLDSYKTRLAELQFRNVIKNGNQPAPRYPNLIKHFIKSKEEFYSVFYEPNKDRKNELLSWDLETSGFNCFKDDIGCITLSFDGVEGYYIPWKYVDPEKLDEILGNNRTLGANAKFDVKFLKKPRTYIKEIRGYLIIEVNGKQYKVWNDQLIETDSGKKLAKDLQESDNILSMEGFLPYEG